jgi:hypothetical protein
MRRLIITLVIVQSSIALLALGYCITLTKDPDFASKYEEGVLVAVFGIVFIFQIFIFILVIKRIKRLYPKFYQKEKAKVNYY